LNPTTPPVSEAYLDTDSNATPGAEREKTQGTVAAAAAAAPPSQASGVATPVLSTSVFTIANDGDDIAAANHTTDTASASIDLAGASWRDNSIVAHYSRSHPGRVPPKGSAEAKSPAGDAPSAGERIGSSTTPGENGVDVGEDEAVDAAMDVDVV
jgi:hypothetical protein